MPRRPRSEFAAGIYHVTARGNRREPIYHDAADRQAYLSRLWQVNKRLGWSCLSYCLMTNHVHLLIETREPNLGEGVRLLHGGFAQGFNRRHGYGGHVFQGRFHAVQMETDPQLWLTAAYIARNPVDAGLCVSAADWPWSSHRAIVTGDAPRWLNRERLLLFFGAYGASDPLKRYEEFVARPKRGDSPLNVCPLNQVAFSWSGGRLKIEIDGHDLVELARQVELPFADAHHRPLAVDVRGGIRQYLMGSRCQTACLLGCECGEPECRPLVAEIEVARDTVSWSHFRQGSPDDRSYDRLGPFVFARRDYERALAKLEH